jgi:hypothetical protein
MSREAHERAAPSRPSGAAERWFDGLLGLGLAADRCEMAPGTDETTTHHADLDDDSCALELRPPGQGLRRLGGIVIVTALDERRPLDAAGPSRAGFRAAASCRGASGSWRSRPGCSVTVEMPYHGSVLQPGIALGGRP